MNSTAFAQSDNKNKLESKQLFACKFAKWTPSLHKLPIWLSRQNYQLLDILFGIKKDNSITTKYFRVKSQAANKQFTIRCYYPDSQQAEYNALVFFHGGGCAIGSLKSHDAFCRFLSKQTNSCVIAVDYGLGPEHPYPTAIINAIEAINYVHERANTLKINRNNIGACGDSAGAYLSLLCDQHELIQDLGVPVQYQLKYLALLYPMLDLTASSEAFNEARPYQLLTPEVMQYFARHYLQDMTKKTEPLASPILAEKLSLSLPCVMITAEFDPLRDDGFALAKRYETESKSVQAGAAKNTQCHHIHASDSTHGFIHLAGLSKKALAHCQRFADKIIQLQQSS